jgi:hypothetical protein
MVLTLDSVPEGLLNRALVVLQRHSDMAELLCLRDQVPEPTLRMMLRHESPAVSTAAAVGDWCSTPRGEIRESIKDDWRAAILRAEGCEHWLSEILKSDKALAYDWLMERVSKDSVYFSYYIMEEMKAAISVLDFGQRAALLQQFRGNGFSDSELISELAGDDIGMYAEILKHRNLAKYHLSPLSGHPVGKWADKSVLAFDAGYSAEEVINSSFDYGETWTGNTSDRWQRWVEEFEALAEHKYPRVREAAGIGAARARENRAEELVRERQEAVYGR